MTIHPLVRSIVASVALALLAVGAFGTMHAIVLKPIWWPLLEGVPFAIAGAAAASWSFSELRHGPWQRWPRLRAGLVFGFGAWLAMLPVTAAGFVLGLPGMQRANGAVETVLELAIVALTGAALGWWLLRTRRGSLATASFVTVLLIVQGGPVPLGNGRRAATVFFSLAVIYSILGLALAAIAGRAPLTTDHPPDTT